MANANIGNRLFNGIFKMNTTIRTQWVVIILLTLAFIRILSGCSSNAKKQINFNLYEEFSQDFRINWKADSLGKGGFREKSVAFDSVRRIWLINGISIIGLSDYEINAVLGKPTISGKGKEDGLLMTFYVTKREHKQIDSEAIQIIFDEHYIVDDIVPNKGF